MKRLHFAILDEDGDFIALDDASGGYPYKAYSVSDMKRWDEFEDAAQYAAIMNKPEWEIIEVEMIVHQPSTSMKKQRADRIKELIEERKQHWDNLLSDLKERNGLR